jgi:hypothetical protein
LLSGILILGGCAGSFGNTAQNSDVTTAFQSGQASSQYTYHYREIPYQGNAIVGLKQPFVMDEYWQVIDLSQQPLDQWVAKMPPAATGAEVLDQNKQPIGVLYAGMKLIVRIKDNQVVSIYSPKRVYRGGGK